MFKITIMLTLLIIGCVVSASLSCQSCGPECEAACGTRRFRTCCFNYLRRKRGPDALKVPVPQSIRSEAVSKLNYPPFSLEESDLWSALLHDYKPNYLDDTVDIGLQALYEA